MFWSRGEPLPNSIWRPNIWLFSRDGIRRWKIWCNYIFVFVFVFVLVHAGSDQQVCSCEKWSPLPPHTSAPIMSGQQRCNVPFLPDVFFSILFSSFQNISMTDHRISPHSCFSMFDRYFSFLIRALRPLTSLISNISDPSIREWEVLSYLNSNNSDLNISDLGQRAGSLLWLSGARCRWC